MKLTDIFKGIAITVALLALGIGAALKGGAVLAALTPPTVTTATLAMSEVEQLEEFGTVEVLSSDQPARGLVILAAGTPDIPARNADAQALAKEGLIVVTFDFDAFRQALAKEPADEDCHYIADDLKDLGQAVQRQLGIKRYFFPVIIGRGDGAAFAYAALAQAPPNTLGGAISIGFEPVIKSDRPYCFEPDLVKAADDLYALPNNADIPGQWRVIAGESERTRIEAFQEPIDAAEYVPAQDEEGTRSALVEGAVRLGHTGERGHSELPVAIIKPEGQINGLAIIVSGDGGWRDIDKSIGEWLAKQGVAVVGVDSLRYFWSKKSPAQVAADLALLFDHYGSEFGTNRYSLVGFSFGADIMPDVWPLLPKTVKDRVQVVSLLALGQNADFEVTVEGFVGGATAESRPLVPLLAQLPLNRTQCIYGKEEAEDGETSCTAPELAQAERLPLEGGHHFDGDYTKAAEAIWRRMQGESAKL
ncbi:virulence factor family protein [Microvirga subterranea]|uniref:Type IV secretory pathway VirJ component n=1 Tax=Microvirga subterranea TaxID=186651 RepID=A0A370HQG9_9HYPH|nr:AcvB/VirJ family lysyl-phosphatidylglycerol hydrolase [Microvirga subterranea]RDI60792.1 type IV secretory pathway VirJ component [Microvirga subterranea]